MSDRKIPESADLRFCDSLTLRQDPQGAAWIIPQGLARGTEIHMFGEEGIGKTRMAWQFAYAVASGKPWLGVFEILEPGPVLFLECDMDRPEMDLMLADAEKAGFLHENIYVPERRILVDLFDKQDQAWLQCWHGRVGPVAVVIDTVNEAGVEENTNKETTRFLRMFRETCPNAGGFLVNHEKKPGTTYKGEPARRSKYSYLGGGWPRKVRTNIQLIADEKPDVGKGLPGKLVIHKWRAQRRISKIDLLQNPGHGFWEAQMTPNLALATWPHCLPSYNGRSECETVADVCRSIAQAFDLRAETVRQAFDRERKRSVEYTWLTTLPNYQYDLDSTTPELQA